jgi:hypothetical protein
MERNQDTGSTERRSWLDGKFEEQSDVPGVLPWRFKGFERVRMLRLQVRRFREVLDDEGVFCALYASTKRFSACNQVRESVFLRPGSCEYLTGKAWLAHRIAGATRNQSDKDISTATNRIP